MTFNDLNLNASLRNALDDMGLSTPTTIQEKVFSPVMSGQDVIGIAQTGTGKTFGYLLPSLRQWQFNKTKTPQILVIVPTRELVQQVVGETEKLTTYMNVDVVGVYGGANIRTQMDAIHVGADVVVGTPGRLMDLLLNKTIKTKLLKKLIIDEVDEMLNLGFRTQLKNILDLLPEKRQNLMFSATLNEEVEALIHDFFVNPKKVEAAPAGTPVEQIEQALYPVANFNTKINLLDKILADKDEMKKVLVFTSGKKLADLLHERLLLEFGDEIGVIHSNKSQNNRFGTVNGFQDGSLRVLIATDLISRGLDIQGVSHVINFDLPDITENYVHRIGRTGRAEAKGNAISFCTEKEQTAREKIEKLMGMEIPELEFPEDVEVSDVLIPDELPKSQQPNMDLKTPAKAPSGEAFHEKKAKNKKVNQKVRYADLMKQRYGKPKKRGQKKRGKRR